MEKEDTTTIRLKISTKELLDEFGKKPESYDDIILRLLKGGKPQ
jgi:hypothetical protein